MSLAIKAILERNQNLSPDSTEKKYNDDLLQVFKAYSYAQSDFNDYAKFGSLSKVVEGQYWLKVRIWTERYRFTYLRTVVAQVNYMLNHHYSPHLTRVHDVQAEQLDEKFNKFKLFTLMERLEGDLEKRSFSSLEWAAFAVQISTTEVIAVERVHLCPKDRKLRNLVFNKIGPEDTFKGQKLQDFDYWHYKIGEDEFYLPRLDYLVKFCDYDDWIPMVSETERFRYDNRQIRSAHMCIEEWLKSLGKISFDEARKLFTRPTEVDSKILDIVIDSEDLVTPFGKIEDPEEITIITEQLQMIPFKEATIKITKNDSEN